MEQASAKRSHETSVQDELSRAAACGDVSPSAVANIRKWLSSPQYTSFRPQLEQQIRAGDFRSLEEAFWRELPFGTAGRRGRMFPVGCNAINDRTIGETVQALAETIRSRPRGPGQAGRFRCAVAYDPRHRSRDFAVLSAEILLAAGFDVHFLDGCRGTPALAWTVCATHCDGGVMITASHNPPQDNAIKIFGYFGGQIREPIDAEIAERIRHVGEIHRTPFAAGVAQGAITLCQDEVDTGFVNHVLGYSADQGKGPRQLQILYSPLQGVGLTSVLPVLRRDGFSDVTVYAPHAQLDPDLANLPDATANPEHPPVFRDLIPAAREQGAQLVLASDLDADRMGAAAPVDWQSADWQVFNGNQLAVLLAEFLLRQRKAQGRLSPLDYLVTTLVTTPLLQRQAEYYGVTCVGDCLTGFKWIGARIDEQGPDHFVFGAEEAHGYLVGDYIRDKDAAGAAMILAEFAAAAAAERRTLWQELELIYLRHGCYAERSFAFVMPGADGVVKTNRLLTSLRSNPPDTLCGQAVTQQRDYLRGIRQRAGHSPEILGGPRSDLLILDATPPPDDPSPRTLRMAVRPSGTEPKLKFYLFASAPVRHPSELPAVRRRCGHSLEQLERSLRTRIREPESS